jgi:hypothetical protein
MNMKKKTAYLVAALTCSGIFITWFTICIMMEWDNLGGIFPTMALFAAIAATWRGITNKPKRESREEAVKAVDYNKEILITIDEEISKVKSTRGNNISSDLILVLENQCTSKEAALDLIDKYSQAFNKDLIGRIVNISNILSQIQGYIKPFIEVGVVEKEYPYDRIED